jgi:hypothetical protein
VPIEFPFTHVLFITAVAPVGAAGTVAVGVTAAVAADEAPVPTELVAVTLNVYEVPLVRPVTMQVRAPVVAQVKEPGVEVTL